MHSGITRDFWLQIAANHDDLSYINGSANCGANDPAEGTDAEAAFHLEASHDGIFWHQCAWSQTVAGLASAIERCPYRHSRIVHVTREVVEVCGHA